MSNGKFIKLPSSDNEAHVFYVDATQVFLIEPSLHNDGPHCYVYVRENRLNVGLAAEEVAAKLGWRR